MGQPVAFFEVISQDAPRAQKFYADLFGWQVAANPAMGGYALVDTGAGEGAIGGGIGPAENPGEAGGEIYMQGDDPDRYLGRAQKPGGQKLVPPPPPPGHHGPVALFTGPACPPVRLWGRRPAG